MIAVGPVTILGVGVALACGVGSLLANRRLQAGARYVAAHREHGALSLDHLPDHMAALGREGRLIRVALEGVQWQLSSAARARGNRTLIGLLPRAAPGLRTSGSGQRGCVRAAGGGAAGVRPSAAISCPGVANPLRADGLKGAKTGGGATWGGAGSPWPPSP